MLHSGSVEAGAHLSETKPAFSATSERRCYMPVCGPIAVCGDLNWPSIYSLCFLDEEQTEKYMREFFFVVNTLQPILTKYKSPCRKMAFVWKKVFADFSKIHTWSEIKTADSLSSTYSRSKRLMSRYIIAHNSLARKATVEERAERTLFFLSLPRRTWVEPLNWPLDMEEPDREVFRPLIEIRVVLKGYPTPNTSNGMVLSRMESDSGDSPVSM